MTAANTTKTDVRSPRAAEDEHLSAAARQRLRAARNAEIDADEAEHYAMLERMGVRV